MSDKVLAQMVQASSLVSAKASAVPEGGLAAILAKASPSPNASSGNGKKGSNNLVTCATDDGFDALRFAEVLISNQLKLDATEAAARQKQEEALMAAQRQQHQLEEEEARKQQQRTSEPETTTSRKETSRRVGGGGSNSTSDETNRRLVPLHTNRAIEPSGGDKSAAGPSSVSPRPSSTPVTHQKRASQEPTAMSSQTPTKQQSGSASDGGSQSAPRPSGGREGAGQQAAAGRAVDGWTTSPARVCNQFTK